MGKTSWMLKFLGGLLAAVVMMVLRFAPTHSSFNKATDDPFTGVWRDNGAIAKMGQLIITPSGDGLSFRRSIYEEPLMISYGKEFVDHYPFLERMEVPHIMATVVRIDDQTLEFSYREDGRLFLKNTYAVSSDGKHLKLSTEYTGGTGRSTIYDRDGPVPDGDAFFGTWNSPLSKMAYITIKADREKIDWYGGALHIVKAKFDGKKYNGDNSSNKATTYQFKRLDDHTIEMVMKSEQFNSREVWKVQSNTLTRTTTHMAFGNQNSGTQRNSASEYRRVK
jgi:hypothetical protein